MNKLFHDSQKGFSAVEVLIVVLIVGVIGGAGYYIYAQNADDSVSSGSSQVADTDVPEAPAINSAQDLNSAEQALDDTDLNASDADLQQLENDLADI